MSNTTVPEGSCVPGQRWDVVPNSDVSGIGVRISFYVQAVLLSVLAARSASADEITDALSTLIVTNMAMCVTTLVLGLKRQLTLYDGLMVCYLLSASWVAIFFALPQYNRYKKSSPFIKLLAVVQSYFVFITILVIFGQAHVFGMFPDCNHLLHMVVFGPFNAVSRGRLAGLIGFSILAAVYTVMVYYDYKRTKNVQKAFKAARSLTRSVRTIGKKSKGTNASASTGGAGTADEEKPPASSRPTSMPAPLLRITSASASDVLLTEVPANDGTSMHSSRPRHRTTGTRPTSTDPVRAAGAFSGNMFTNYKANIDGRVILNLVLIAIASACAITNIELLRHFNHPTNADNEWGFGQILPMFLVVLPLQRTILIFHEQGLGPKKNREKSRTKRVRVKKAAPQEQPFDFGGMGGMGGMFGMGAGMFGGMGGGGGMFGGRPPQMPVPNGGARIEEVPSSSEDEIDDDDVAMPEPRPAVRMPDPGAFGGSAIVDVDEDDAEEIEMPQRPPLAMPQAPQMSQAPQRPAQMPRPPAQPAPQPGPSTGPGTASWAKTSGMV